MGGISLQLRTAHLSTQGVLSRNVMADHAQRWRMHYPLQKLSKAHPCKAHVRLVPHLRLLRYFTVQRQHNRPQQQRLVRSLQHCDRQQQHQLQLVPVHVSLVRARHLRRPSWHLLRPQAALGAPRRLRMFTPYTRATTRFIGVITYHRVPRVITLTQWGATLELRLWPTPLGPPPGHVPGRLSARARRRGRTDEPSAAAQTC